MTDEEFTKLRQPIDFMLGWDIPEDHKVTSDELMNILHSLLENSFESLIEHAQSEFYVYCDNVVKLFSVYHDKNVNYLPFGKPGIQVELSINPQAKIKAIEHQLSSMAFIKDITVTYDAQDVKNLEMKLDCHNHTQDALVYMVDSLKSFIENKGKES